MPRCPPALMTPSQATGATHCPSILGYSSFASGVGELPEGPQALLGSSCDTSPGTGYPSPVSPGRPHICLMTSQSFSYCPLLPSLATVSLLSHLRASAPTLPWPPPPSGLCTNVTSSERPSPATFTKSVPLISVPLLLSLTLQAVTEGKTPSQSSSHCHHRLCLQFSSAAWEPLYLQPSLRQALFSLHPSMPTRLAAPACPWLLIPSVLNTQDRG